MTEGCPPTTLLGLPEVPVTPTTVKIRDESTTRGAADEWTLEFLDERLTVRELIRSRVYQEVRDYNAKQPGVFRGLVQPTDAERVLNGYKLRPHRKIDWEEQYRRALDAFRRNGFVIVVDDRQMVDLDEELDLHHDSTATFLKLQSGAHHLCSRRVDVFRSVGYHRRCRPAAVRRGT